MCPPRIGLSGTWQPAARLSMALQNNATVATNATTTPRHRCARTARNTSTLLPVSTHVGEKGNEIIVGAGAAHCQWTSVVRRLSRREHASVPGQSSKGRSGHACVILGDLYMRSMDGVALVSEIVIW